MFFPESHRLTQKKKFKKPIKRFEKITKLTVRPNLINRINFKFSKL